MLDPYPPDLQAFVEQKIASGEFKSVDEFAIHAATVYRDIEQRRQQLMELVNEGIAEIESGNYIVLDSPEDFRALADDIKKRGRERLRQLSNE